MPATLAAGILVRVNGYAKLERQFRADLNRPRITNGADLTYERRSHVRAGDSPEVSVIEDIEYLHAHLQLPFVVFFAELKVLQQREVKALGRRSSDSAAST